MKTEALKEALNVGKYDFIYGGARRDEEKVDQKKGSYHREIKIIVGIQRIKELNRGIYSTQNMS